MTMEMKEHTRKAESTTTAKALALPVTQPAKKRPFCRQPPSLLHLKSLTMTKSKGPELRPEVVAVVVVVWPWAKSALNGSMNSQSHSHTVTQSHSHTVTQLPGSITILKEKRL